MFARFALIALALAGSLLVFFLRSRPEPTPTRPEPTIAADSASPHEAAGASSTPLPSEPRPAPETLPEPPSPAADDPPAEHPAEPAAGAPDITRHLDHIEAAVSTYESAALPVVAAYLLHPRPEVREAARQGMIQLGLAEGAPLLREAAGKTKNPREAVALLDAAEFLELPTGSIPGGRLSPGKEPPAEPRTFRPRR